MSNYYSIGIALSEAILQKTMEEGDLNEHVH